MYLHIYVTNTPYKAYTHYETENQPRYCNQLITKRSKRQVSGVMNTYRNSHDWDEIEKRIFMHGVRIDDPSTWVMIRSETLAVFIFACVLKCSRDKDTGCFVYNGTEPNDIYLAVSIIEHLKGRFLVKNRMMRMVLYAAYHLQDWDTFTHVFIDMLTRFDSRGSNNVDIAFPNLPREKWLEILYEMKKRNIRCVFPDIFDNSNKLGAWTRDSVYETDYPSYTLKLHELKRLEDALVKTVINSQKLVTTLDCVNMYKSRTFTIIVDGSGRGILDQNMHCVLKYKKYARAILDVCISLAKLSHIPVVFMTKSNVLIVKNNLSDDEYDVISMYTCILDDGVDVQTESIFASLRTSLMFVTTSRLRMKKFCRTELNLFREWEELYIVRYIIRDGNKKSSMSQTIELFFPKIVRERVHSVTPTAKRPYCYMVAIKDDPFYAVFI